MRQFNFTLILILTLLLSKITFSQIDDKELSTLAKYIGGIYTSELQAKADSDYSYIILKIYPVWKERTDAYWFYIEQAVTQYEDKPYRQRFYRLTRVDSLTFESAIFSFNDPLKYTGDLEKVNKELNPDSLKKRDGCSVYIKRVDEEHFFGITRDKDCPSEHRKAKYATSEAKIYKDKMLTWDRGFDDNNIQVWGAKKGSYIFDKVKELE